MATTCWCISSSKTVKLLRPIALARYIAVSESRSRSSARLYSGFHSAMPMLMVAKTSLPSRSNGTLNSSWMRSAATVAPRISLMSSTRITNSSPPNLATVSPGRHAFSTRSAIIRRS